MEFKHNKMQLPLAILIIKISVIFLTTDFRTYVYRTFTSRIGPTTTFFSHGHHIARYLCT